MPVFAHAYDVDKGLSSVGAATLSLENCQELFCEGDTGQRQIELVSVFEHQAKVLLLQVHTEGRLQITLLG